MSASDTIGEIAQFRGDGRSGSHHRAFRAEDGSLVVEWEEYRDPAPYDHATTIRMNATGEASMMAALGVVELSGSVPAMLAQRFDTFWAVREFADRHTISYEYAVDFRP